MSVEIIRVPDTGSSDPVDVIEVSVKVGDEIAEEDTIVVLESDKATVEVPAPRGGKVAKLLVSTGDRVKEGDPLLEVEAEGADGKPDSKPDQKADSGGKSAARSEPAAEQKPGSKKKDDKPKKQDKPARKSSAARTVTVNVPDLGDIDGAELIELQVAKGDSIEAEQILGVLESDKASLEIPAPSAGTISKLLVKVGDKLKTGDPMLEMQANGENDESAENGESSQPEQPSKPDHPASTKSASADKSDTGGKASDQPRNQPRSQSPKNTSSDLPKANPNIHAGPAVRKLARELGADLAGISGSGPKGRILKEDVHEHVKTLLTEGPAAASGGGAAVDLPDIDFSKFGETERVELNKLRRVSATNLHRSWLTIPHVTQHDQADITDLEAFRQTENKRLAKQDIKLTMLAFLVKASAVALKAFPDFNSSMEKGGQALIHKHYINIGVAVDTPNGLVVPVVRDADKKGLAEIAAEVSQLAGKARDRKLTPGDMQGGTFSISSLGGIGGTAFTPVVNWPEVAILGVSRAQMTPQWNGSEFQPRLMLPLSLSYDHRVIDGASAARFSNYLVELLGDMRRALM